MNQRLLSSVEYIYNSGQKTERQEIIINKKNNKLSPISLSILDSVLSHKITLIFSQGPLNLSPIISCIFCFQKKNDVLIGIPKTRFNEYFEKNTEIYFSLIYKKLINLVPSSSFYFYLDILWCKGCINQETNEMTDIEVSTRPKHGTRKYKNNYDSDVNENLMNGNFQKIPKIVSIPIDDIAPSSIVGEKSIEFENTKYKLKDFNPKLIIYESINERKYSFENLLTLINKSEKSDIKLVLHFSWPYLKGLSAFLGKVKDNNNIRVLHLGKRFCIESCNTFEKPPSNLMSLSLEGELWDFYYPVDTSINFRIILPPVNTRHKVLPTKEIIYLDWPLDSRVTDIREKLKFENVDNLEKGILQFPPILDSFLSPSETKRHCIKNGAWITTPINNSFSTKTKENSHAINVFNGLCSDLEKCRDVAYELRGLFTTTTVSKKTLFQAYLIEKMDQLCNINDVLKPEVHSDSSIFIANLHPYLVTQSSFSESIRYLVNSIKKASKILKSFRLLNHDNLIFLEVESPNGEKFKEIIYKGGIIQNQNVNTIKKIFFNLFPNIYLFVFKKNNALEIILKVNEPIVYLEFFHKSNQAKNASFGSFTFYNAMIKNDGSFNEKRFSSISLDRKANNLLMQVEIEHNTEKSKRRYTYEIQLLYSDLSKMQSLPKELIKRSELLIPGPIPFHTISDQDILISHGYDALLLPFKNVVFFVYPGTNFKQLLKQINLYNDLISEKQSSVSIRDLSFSIEHTDKSRRFNLPSKNYLTGIQDEISNCDTPVDTTIRKELLDDSSDDGYELEDIKTLKDIWTTIQMNGSYQSRPHSFVHQPLKEHIKFYVEYDTGVRDIISFSLDTLIRKKDGNEYILLPIDELSEGDQIFYVQLEERESIENYLLRTILSEDEMSLEGILEPLIALKNFYETLSSLDFRKNYDENLMKKIYWLSLNQKKNLYDLLRSLLDRGSLLSKEEIQILILNSIWNGIVAERLIEIFNKGKKRITQSKLFDLAVEMGLTLYQETSFKGLCSTAINEQTHYSFHNGKNLFSLGKLLGHHHIINYYQVINEKGIMVGKFLRQVGRSLQRVANGNGEPFNAIDIALEENLKKCIIVKIDKDN